MPDELKRGENALSESRKNQYNAFIVLLAQYACNNDLKQVFLACSKRSKYVMEITVDEALQRGMSCA